MLKRLRKSSGQVSLVLIGVAALAGCSDDRRNVYASREDCLADWGTNPADCSAATDPRHLNRGYFYGPTHTYRTSSGRSSGTFSSPSRSFSWGSSGGGSSRSGFGSSGRLSSSSS